jgi:hypothetical protein
MFFSLFCIIHVDTRSESLRIMYASLENIYQAIWINIKRYYYYFFNI